MNATRTAVPWATIALACLVGCARHYVYQNTDWGMSEKEFRAARPASAALPSAAGERLWLEHTTINGLKSRVTYRLGPKGLQDVTVVFDPVQVEKAQYIDYYHQVKALLSDKYGAPEVESADLAVRSQKYRMVQAPDYQSKCIFRTPFALIQLVCGGNCDGSSAGDAITITYEAPRARTEGL
jgi:hypothetical protein